MGSAKESSRKVASDLPWGGGGGEEGGGCFGKCLPGMFGQEEEADLDGRNKAHFAA